MILCEGLAPSELPNQTFIPLVELRLAITLLGYKPSCIMCNNDFLLNATVIVLQLIF